MVRIYTINNCPYCAELKTLLTNEGIKYIEINVDEPQNQDEFNRLYEFTKSNDVPIVKVGQQILVPQVSFRSIKECCELTKKFIV